ncbi:putative glycosyltransferase EpsJ [Acetatifactor muris]|uniref:Putative glycosyltransferase EpsJ n=1 Tax=Acetatifactor muris TaxID=879566 RepID=A0A2K4ZER1_9FIRM|nr:putative glycosyltransferase EpsJ [Acetatifactor muris]
MAVYILGQPEKYVLAGLYYGKTYRRQILTENSGQVQYVYTELPEHKRLTYYEEEGIEREKILGVHQYLTGNNKIFSSKKTEDKLEELKAALQFTDIEYRDSEIRLIKDGFVIAKILLDEKDRSRLWAICYYSCAKLLRMEVYTDRVFYVNYYKTADSENGLYAKLVRRTFYDRDGSSAYDQIFEDEKEWYLFPDGRRYTRPQLNIEFIRRLNLSEQDSVILDASVPTELMQAIFTFGKGAIITAIAHAGCYFVKKEGSCESFCEEYPYNWLQYVEMIDRMIVSTEAQKTQLIKELEKYHCNIPDIRVIPVEGAFTYTVLNESYAGNLALSWSFSGKTDGFQIYDETGKEIYETWNRHQHYFLIKGYGKASGFVVRAYIDTVKGKEIIAESKPVYIQNQSYEKPLVSLVIPAYNAEDYIVRTIDNALAQSFAGLEVIVVNDGSIDSTPDILEWYAERYSNVIIIHQENGGTAVAKNTGIGASNGEYTGFMDNDDMIHPDMMKELYCLAQKNNCDIACTSAYEIRNDGYVPFMHYPIKEDTAVTIEEFISRHFVTNYMWTVNVWNKIYRSSLIKAHLFPVITGDDEAWTSCILSWADNICWINGYLYEHDRVIRCNTLFDEWMKQSYEEKFNMHMKASLFYLKNGNPAVRKLLKELVRRELHEWGKIYASETYEEVWKEVDENF